MKQVFVLYEQEETEIEAEINHRISEMEEKGWELESLNTVQFHIVGDTTYYPKYILLFKNLIK